MRSILNLTASLATAMMTASCLDTSIDCDCPTPPNIALKIIDGANEGCVTGAEISLLRNGLVFKTVPVYDDVSCTYAFFSGSGRIGFTVEKSGFADLRVDSLAVGYVKAGCCGEYEKKAIDVKWYPAILGIEPEIIFR